MFSRGPNFRRVGGGIFPRKYDFLGNMAPRGGANFIGNLVKFPREFGPGEPKFGEAKFPGTPATMAVKGPQNTLLS
jgi:hypothetical protein